MRPTLDRIGRLLVQFLRFGLVPLFLGCGLEQGGGRLGSALLELILLEEVLPDAPLALPEQQVLPLITRGRQIVDRQGKPVQLRCVNWYGAHMQDMVVGGLHKQPLDSLVRSIHTLGFNCVRLPYSLEMHLDRGISRPSSDAVKANPHFVNMTVSSIFDATIKALAAAHIMVILNNHQGKAMWCCSEDDGEGLWFSKEYSEEDWLRSLRSLARQYRAEPYVVGYDLRNEPRGIPADTARSLQLQPQGRYLWPSWSKITEPGHANWAVGALHGGLAVAEEDPDALIIVEGLDFATDLRGVALEPLHRQSHLQGRVVYEVHDYCWYHPSFFRSWQLYWLSLGWLLCAIFEMRKMKFKVGVIDEHRDDAGHTWPLPSPIVKKLLFLCAASAMISSWMVSYSSFKAKLDDRWGYILEANEAPIWLGEFGTNGYWTTAVWWMEVGEVLWLQHLLRYVREHELGYAYWALNGDKQGEVETFGLFKEDYVSLQHPWLLQMLW